MTCQKGGVYVSFLFSVRFKMVNTQIQACFLFDLNIFYEQLGNNHKLFFFSGKFFFFFFGLHKLIKSKIIITIKKSV